MFGIISIYRLATLRLSSLAVCGCGVFGCILMISGCGKTSSTEAKYGEGGVETIATVRSQADSLSPANASEGMVSSGTAPSAAVPSVPAPSVAVIDVNKVATQLGTANMISAMVDEKERALQQNFRTLQQKFMVEYNSAAQSIGDQPTPEQESDLLSLQQRHMDLLSAEWIRMQQETGDFHDELKKQFVDSVRPVAAAVARSKNIPTVLTSGQVFSSEDNCDITNDVAAAMQQILREAARQADSADSAGNLR